MRNTQRAGRVTIIGLWMVLMVGCSPFGLVDTSDATADMLDPEVIKNQQGVVALYNSSVLGLAKVIAGSQKNSAGVDDINTQSFVRLVGHVSDEMDYRTTTKASGSYSQLDISIRNFDPNPTGGGQNFFNRLSNLRITAAETQAGFRVYGALLSDTILAHAMVVEAAALIMTAELYCSGVPLSTREYNGDIRMTRGYSTNEVYTFALAKLDTASTLSQGNARLSSFIDVLRIRVLLGMGRIQEAADRASHVETSFRYGISYAKTVLTANANGSVNEYYGKFTVANAQYNNSSSDQGVERISDRKGGNGLPYAFGNDPRVTLPELKDPWAPFVMASGVEARLAEAEAALKRDDPSWLTILNQLRTSCTSQDACPTPAPSGSGSVSGLELLEDPGTAAARLSMLFDERAYWLFLRGFRQGDLRRRIRVYGGSVETLYPVGFPEVGNVAYGYMVALPVPMDEQRYNPNYKGCLNNDA